MGGGQLFDRDNLQLDTLTIIMVSLIVFTILFEVSETHVASFISCLHCAYRLPDKVLGCFFSNSLHCTGWSTSCCTRCRFITK